MMDINTVSDEFEKAVTQETNTILKSEGAGSVPDVIAEARRRVQERQQQANVWPFDRDRITGHSR
jgi:hypothetical protein